MLKVVFSNLMLWINIGLVDWQLVNVQLDEIDCLVLKLFYTTQVGSVWLKGEISIFFIKVTFAEFLHNLF